MKKLIVVAMLVTLGVAALYAAEAAKDKVLLVNDFENDADKDMFKDSTASIEVSDQHATHGKHSLKVTWEGNKPLSALATMPGDWSKYKWFKFDLFNDGPDTNFTVRVRDGNGKGYDVWQYPVPQGASTITLNLETAKGNIDLSKVTQFFMYLVDEGKATGFVDNVRLEP